VGRGPFAAPYNLYLPQSELQDGFRQVDAEEGGREGSSCPEPLDRRPNRSSVGIVRRWKSQRGASCWDSVCLVISQSERERERERGELRGGRAARRRVKLRYLGSVGPQNCGIGSLRSKVV